MRRPVNALGPEARGGGTRDRRPRRGPAPSKSTTGNRPCGTGSADHPGRRNANDTDLSAAHEQVVGDLRMDPPAPAAAFCRDPPSGGQQPRTTVPCPFTTGTPHEHDHHIGRAPTDLEETLRERRQTTERKQTAEQLLKQPRSTHDVRSETRRRRHGGFLDADITDGVRQAAGRMIENFQLPVRLQLWTAPPNGGQLIRRVEFRFVAVDAQRDLIDLD